MRYGTFQPGGQVKTLVEQTLFAKFRSIRSNYHHPWQSLWLVQGEDARIGHQAERRNDGPFALSRSCVTVGRSIPLAKVLGSQAWQVGRVAESAAASLAQSRSDRNREGRRIDVTSGRDAGVVPGLARVTVGRGLQLVNRARCQDADVCPFRAHWGF